MTSISSPPKFATVVRTKLAENRAAGRKPNSIRGLARIMAKGDLALAETHKRSLFKWMAASGPSPSVASRELVAGALGNCEAGELADDDEESDPMVDLYAAVRRIVRAEMAQVTA